jgi:tRNA nucleotidyltransferase (CCA-adding enzyme)
MEQKNKLTKKTKLQKRKEIYSKVLKKISPRKKDIEEEKKIFEEIKDKIEEIEGNHSHIEWCGSSARGTHLKGDRDLDLFLMFDKEMSENELEKEGLRVGKRIFRGHKWEKAYSQHPYIRGIIKGFDIEIVPSYIVSSGKEKKSAVDRTPFHNKFLLKKMSKKQKEDARLLKQFLKGINAYGADLKNQSLPGYAVELLILYYENFEKALKEMNKWKQKTKIKFNSKKAKKFSDPLIIIDPVDPNRNVASALSENQLERIKYASKMFLEKPSKKFFFRKKIRKMEKKKVREILEKKELIGLKANFPKTILNDLVWGQVRKLSKRLANYLEENDFGVMQKDFWSNENEIIFVFALNTLILQKARKLVGPKVEDEENVKRFLKGKKILSGPRIEKGRVVIEIERKETRAEKHLQNAVKKIRQEKIGMRRILTKTKVLDEKELLKEYKGEFAEFLTLYLKGKDVFE